MKLYCASFNFSENKCSLAQNKQVQWRLEKRVMSHVPCWPFHTDGPRWLPYSASAASLFCLHATKASWGLQIHTTKSCLQRLHQRRVCACEAPHPPSLWNNWTSNWKDHGVVFFFLVIAISQFIFTQLLFAGERITTIENNVKAQQCH